MTTPDMQPESPIRAVRFNRFGFYVGSYIPVLTASVTPPDLGGEAAEAEGQWMQLGQLMYVWARLRFGSASGNPPPDAGSGIYMISLPTPATDLFASDIGAFGTPIGSGIVGDNETIPNSRKTFVQLATAGDFETGEVATVQLGIYSGSFGSVTEASPFAWAARDRMAFHCIYPTQFLVDIEEGSGGLPEGGGGD